MSESTVLLIVVLGGRQPLLRLRSQLGGEDGVKGTRRFNNRDGKMKKLQIALLISILSFQSHSTTLLGTFDCKEWFEPRKSEFAKTWLTGYLSGMNAGNFFLGDKTDYLKENSVNENINWMTNFCKENSNGLVVTGANKLVGELYRKHQKP